MLLAKQYCDLLTFTLYNNYRPHIVVDTTLDETETCSVYRAVHVEGENSVNLLGLFFALLTSKEEIAKSNCTTTRNRLNNQPKHNTN